MARDADRNRCHGDGAAEIAAIDTPLRVTAPQMNFETSALTYGIGAHAVELEVDTTTGWRKIVKLRCRQ